MIPLPKTPKIIEKKGNFASFEIDGLYPGYGITIGNTLRRVLLSSLPGAAITNVKINNVKHEFSTIPGVLEDTVEILLNLKQLRFKLYTEEPQKAVLKVKGEKKVKGSDFKLPSQVELANKDAYIASLTSESASLEIEVLIESGLGYEPVERRKKGKVEIGNIPVDAIFSPVRKINYHVENMRVGERTDFDRLVLNVETDGTLTPEEAFSKASETLIKHFSLFSETFKVGESNPKSGAKENEENEEIGENAKEGKDEEEMKKEEKGGSVEKQSSIMSKSPIGELEISARTLNILLKNGIKTIGGILRKKEQDLLEIEGMGRKGIQEIKEKLKKLGLSLKK